MTCVLIWFADAIIKKMLYKIVLGLGDLNFETWRENLGEMLVWIGQVRVGVPLCNCKRDLLINIYKVFLSPHCCVRLLEI